MIHGTQLGSALSVDAACDHPEIIQFVAQGPLTSLFDFSVAFQLRCFIHPKIRPAVIPRPLTSLLDFLLCKGVP